jgi:hypothetical protein
VGGGGISRIALSAVASGANGFTTTGVNTTGANLLVFPFACYTLNATTPIDSYGNAWTGLTTYGAGGYWSTIWYCLNPTAVGAGHTITLTGVTTYDAGCLVAYSGVAALDTSTGATSSGSPGSITPAAAGDLFLTMAANSGISSDYPTPPAGFSLLGHQAFSNGVGDAFGAAELISTGSGAQNPTWVPTSGGNISSAMVAFKK